MCFPTLSAVGQHSEKRFSHYTISEGLSQNSIQAICQDSLGFMWFGTKDGLNKFDGYNFTVFKFDQFDSNSISSNYVSALALDTKGQLWIGMESGHINRMDPVTHEVTHFVDKTITSGSVKSSVSYIHAGQDSRVFFGTRGNGIIVFDSKTNSFSRYCETCPGYELPSNISTTLTHDRKGRFWLGTHDKGLFVADNNFSNWKHIKFPDRMDDIMPSKRVEHVYCDTNDDLWIGTASQAYLYSNFNDTLTVIDIPKTNEKLRTHSVLSIVQQRNTIWMMVYLVGLVEYDIETQRIILHKEEPCNPSSILSNGLSKLFVDKSKNLWIATAGFGVSKLSANHDNFSLYQKSADKTNSLCAESIRAITEDSAGHVYIGGYGGVTVFNKFRQGDYMHILYDLNDTVNSLRTDAVHSLLVDSYNNLWIGLEGMALHRIDQKTDKLYTYNIRFDENKPEDILANLTYELFQDSNGQIWIGMAHGLLLYHKESDTFTKYLNNENDGAGYTVYAIQEDENGNLWLGTRSGLIYFNTRTKQHRLFDSLYEDVHNTLPLNIYSILIDDNNVLWLGTDGYGILKFTFKNDYLNFQESTFTQVFKRTQLEKAVVYGILQDDANNLWFSTNNGLYNYKPQSKSLVQYTEADGVQSDEFNNNAFYKAIDGRLYFGGIKGVTAFYPDRIRQENLQSKVVITDIRLLNNEQSKNVNYATIDMLQVDYQNNYVGFEFASLDFIAPEKNEFSVRMIGYNDEWDFIGTRRFVEYSNLPPGQYQFQVKASNNAGIWNEKPTTLDIVIRPPFFQTAWFKLIIILIVIALIIVFVRLRLASYSQEQLKLQQQIKTQKQKLELEKLRYEYAVSKALIEGQNSEQKRISEDLHDGLGQTLTAASLNLMALENELKSPNVKQQEYLNSLKKLLNNTIHDIRNISHNLMPSLLEEEGLESALDELCNRNLKGIKMDISLQINGLDERIDENIEISVFRIVQEVISNTIKHASASSLNIRLTKEGNQLILDTIDDGIGFNPETTRKKGIGLKNITVRTTLLKGNIKVDSVPGKGTHIRIEIPLKLDANNLDSGN